LVRGRDFSTLIEGRQRYPINVRYQRDYRSDLEALGRVLVQSSSNRQVALPELATIRMANAPAMLRDEDGLLTGYVFVDVGGRSSADYVAQARRELHNKLQLPAGYAVLWSGQYESAERVRQRLLLVVPVTLVLIRLLLYFNTRSIAKTAIITLAVPFSAVGALWMVYLLGYNMSIAVWVGIIALLGIDAETGVFMLLYLDLAFA
jgi:Cu(I)/Ag(I) efflux system membrane protein CusA/SilA